MEISRITSKGQTTIPRRVRERLGLNPGDILEYSVEDDRIVMRKVGPQADLYLMSLDDTLTEWLSPEDEEAFRDL